MEGVARVAEGLLSSNWVVVGLMGWFYLTRTPRRCMQLDVPGKESGSK